MRFKITRTSLRGKKPCDDAYSKRVKTWDFRTFASEAEHDARFPRQPWRAAEVQRGANHPRANHPQGGPAMRGRGIVR